MAEEIQNIFDDVVELKKLNPWLAAFALTDSEVKAIIKLISRIIIGSIDISDFYSEMKKIVRKDDEMIKKITMAAIKNRFVPIKGQIPGVDELINQLGGLIAVEMKQEEQKLPDQTSSNSSISFFHEDDEEIKQIMATGNLSANVHDYASLSELIISESGYSLDGDEVIFGRLKNIIIARLKDIRDEIETLEALKKSRKIGGLEMTDEQAKKILTIVKEKISQGLLSKVEKAVEEKKPISFPTKKPFVTGKITLDAKKNLDNHQSISELKKVAEKKVEKPTTQLSKLLIEEEDGLPVIKFPQGDDLMVKPKVVDLHVTKSSVAVAQPVINSTLVKSLEKPQINKIEEITSEVQKPIPTPQPQPMTQSTLPPKSIRFGKKLVDGVRVGGMLVGPVEELGTMTLINFRRLGETPYKSIAKIKEKIDLLEKDSYTKRLQGIEAWHKSEVNRFYRLLGQESMRQERSIDDIINERLIENKPTLSVEEFNSVMELNRVLRY